MIDMMKALFRSGVPYDADTNTFQVRPEHGYLIEQQREQIEEAKDPFRSIFRTRWDSTWDDD